MTFLVILIAGFCDATITHLDPLTKCFGKYGCFSVKYPWYSSHRVVNLFPKSAREIEADIFLYTRKNRRKPQQLYEDDEDSILGSHFSSKRWIFTIF